MHDIEIHELDWHEWIQQPDFAHIKEGDIPLRASDIVDEVKKFEAGDDAEFAKGLLGVAKAAYGGLREELEAEFAEAPDGAVYVRRHALGMDQILAGVIESLMTRAGLDAKGESGLALVAVGGYGRGELAPFSDIDILILGARESDKVHDGITEKLLYLMWDLGLKVGNSRRTVNETVLSIREDHTILTSLLEMRFLAGDAALYDSLNKSFWLAVERMGNDDFVEAKLAERDQRRRKQGDTRFVLEPNIKEGKGGLRDLHSLFWIAKFVCRTDKLSVIIEKGVLLESEAKRFAMDERYLWTVRCHLHLLAGRAEERLDFNMQTQIAPKMGFEAHGNKLAVERFMRRYHLVVCDVGNLTRTICSTLEVDFRKGSGSWTEKFRKGTQFGGFTIHSGRVNLDSKLTFREEPIRLMTIFRLAHEHEADINPRCLHRLTHELGALDEAQRKDPAFAAEFLSILTSRKNPERALRFMNESGVLGRYIPEFRKIVAMMQFDMYHSYTVDEHTIKVIGILFQIEAGEFAEVAPIASSVMPELESRTVLIVAALLHDMAKGRDGDHSILGAELALELCPRLGLDSKDTETVSWLVRHHLLMSNTAFKYDLNDPKTITDFAAIIQSPERLKLLLVLTVADINGVGPTTWNSWRAALLRDLYHRCNSVLAGGDPNLSAAGDATAAKEVARQELSGWSDKEFDDHASRLPQYYWTGFDTASHVRHADFYRNFKKGDGEFLADFRIDDEHKVTELTLLTVDHDGLFSQIAGAVASHGLSIAGARGTTCADGIVLDVFKLETPEHELVSDSRLLERVRGTVQEAVRGNHCPQEELLRRWRRVPERLRQLPVPTRVILSNKISSLYTVIEVNGRDFPGLLYGIAKVLSDLDLKIKSANISTYGERVVDVFYVKDDKGNQITSQKLLDKVHDGLRRVFDEFQEAT